MEKAIDKVFELRERAVQDFTFDKVVAGVFDDMVSRSVPFYDEMQRMSAELAGDFATDGSNLYDIGCSTGTSLIAFSQRIRAKTTLIGLDNSHEMLKKAEEKLAAAQLNHAYKLEYADLHKGLHIENASLVSMILTLQFVRPLYRERIVKQIYDGLNENGAFLMIEKLTSEDTIFNRLFIAHYYDYKRRNGYSDMEIANKREALENVLIPYRMEENFELLRDAGFSKIDVFFRWYNFCGIIAKK
ncbi:MAG: carboxy-S-adenosyl-L-methionine synthase CmoA [Azospirillum brasilense]|nr:MAG: carboxy-S-adenosyl-L-methionine synthase CmoA [Azospirillum brasilense]